jgi:hypothetical protein
VSTALELAVPHLRSANRRACRHLRPPPLCHRGFPPDRSRLLVRGGGAGLRRGPVRATGLGRGLHVQQRCLAGLDRRRARRKGPRPRLPARRAGRLPRVPDRGVRERASRYHRPEPPAPSRRSAHHRARCDARSGDACTQLLPHPARGPHFMGAVGDHGARRGPARARPALCC